MHGSSINFKIDFRQGLVKCGQMDNDQFLSKSYVYILGDGPKYTIIEKVAAELAAVWYEAGRSAGMTSKHKTARLYAKKNFTTWIPKSVEILTSMLGRQDIPDLMKQEIYDAIIERANDPKVKDLKMRADGKRYYDGQYKIAGGGVNPFLKNN